MQDRHDLLELNIWPFWPLYIPYLRNSYRREGGIVRSFTNTSKWWNHHWYLHLWKIYTKVSSCSFNLQDTRPVRRKSESNYQDDIQRL